MIGIVPVHGTGDTEPNAWWRPGSAVLQFLAGEGLELAPTRRPFEWTGDLDGVPWDNGRDWPVEAGHLADVLAGLPWEFRNLICHSHGGELGLMATLDLEDGIRSLVTIGTPARKALRTEIGPKAIKKIGAWRHLYDPKFDPWGLAGQLFDGRIDWRFFTGGDRAFHLAGMEDTPVKGMSHSKILREAKFFPAWRSSGALETLVAGPASRLAAV